MVLPSMSSGRSILLALLITSTPCLAAFGASTDGIAIFYKAGARCPDAAEFIAKVHERTAHARLASSPAEATISVEVGLADDHAVGRLERASASGAPEKREVSGASCEDVASAMALIAALMIEESSPPAASASASASAPLVCPPAPPASAPAPLPLPKPPLPSGVRIGIAATFLGGVVPGLMIAEDNSVDLALSRSDPHGPFVGASFTHGMATRNNQAGAARSWLYVGRLNACPVAWPMMTDLRLLGCGSLGIGAVTLQGDADVPVSSTRLWADAGLSARLDWQVYRSISLAAAGGALIPFKRYSFVFANPDREYFAVSPAVGVASIGLSVDIP